MKNTIKYQILSTFLAIVATTASFLIDYQYAMLIAMITLLFGITYGFIALIRTNEEYLQIKVQELEIKKKEVDLESRKLELKKQEIIALGIAQHKKDPYGEENEEEAK